MYITTETDIEVSRHVLACYVAGLAQALDALTDLGERLLVCRHQNPLKRLRTIFVTVRRG
jgi:hypothetical protein